jgi:hypothetical protein
MNSAAAIAFRTLDTVAIKDIGNEVAVSDGAIQDSVGDVSFDPSSGRASVTVSFPEWVDSRPQNRKMAHQLGTFEQTLSAAR